MLHNTRTAMRCLLLIASVVCTLSCTRHTHADKQIFRYNESAGISTLDPAFAKDQSIIWPCRQLYNGLVQLDSNMQVQPCIASSWTVSADGLEYNFALRTDVSFHNGRRVVADDFVYSLGRLTDPQVASPGGWIMAGVASVQATTDSTLRIRLSQPFAPFLAQLGMVYCSVVPREEVERWGKEYRSHPCGTGPFRFQYWKEGVKLVLRRNPNYFERDTDGSALPKLDAVAVSFIVERQTVFLEFVKGNLDFMNSLDASYKDEVLTPNGTLKPKYANRINLYTTPYLNTEYLGFAMEQTGSPLSDRRIRQAISLGFDRQKMMRYLRNNIGMAGEQGFVPPALLASADSIGYGYHYDPHRAQALIAEAGYPGGKGLPKITLSTTSNYLDLCKYIQQQLGLIGIDVKVDVNPPAALREQMAQGRSAWFRGSWVADYPDAENYLSLFYSPNRSPAGPNYTRFASPTFDRLYTEARSTTDANRRAALYRAMDSIVMAEAPVLVLYYDQILHFTHKRVHGLRTDAMNTLDLRYTYLAPR